MLHAAAASETSDLTYKRRFNDYLCSGGRSTTTRYPQANMMRFTRNCLPLTLLEIKEWTRASNLRVFDVADGQLILLSPISDKSFQE